MKNLLKSSFILLAVASMTFLASCGDDDTEEPLPDMPTVEVTAEVAGEAATSPADANVGDEVAFTVNASTPGGFNVARLWLSTDGGTSSSQVSEATRLDLDIEAGSVTAGVIFTFTVSENFLDKTLDFEIEVVDDADQTATAEFTVNVVSKPARSYSAVLLAAPTDNFENENFFSVSSGEIYSRSEVNATTEAISPTIDFGYYYGGTDKASIASPKGFESTNFADQVSGWGTKNATTLKTTTMTASQFLETSSYADIDAAYEAGTTDDNGIITDLVADQVLAFETVDGVKGLIHIATIDLGTDDLGYSSDAYVEINVLAQLDPQ